MRVFGIPSEKLNRVYDTQKQPMWCWSASMQMLLQYHGLNVKQETIVQKMMGKDRWGNLPNKPGSFMDITGYLNQMDVDHNGTAFHVESLAMPVAPDAQTILREIRQNHPILISYKSRPNMGHLVLLTAVKYAPGSNGSKITHLIVRDPWPKKSHMEKKGRLEYPIEEFLPKIQAYWIVRVTKKHGQSIQTVAAPRARRVLMTPPNRHYTSVPYQRS